ncbi:sodium:solute symporter family protein [Picrophilus oshimae]|uniref:Monocarboxylic acid/H+ symporter MctP n=1 Tax=Picrophilus torridus (strain ATCC 700027 / DSM 9790 / JCM 10055 / NBRC 100828 / KAW 2/3) TaxID=1122961 RepID=Q6L0B1_PICTO|nr:sodium:solute symporter [Picrophilus oshimae]AAT43591.1 monocarboxylic acid/H+ symporter MctP [Picrophilus oshimae DSM 9789]
MFTDLDLALFFIIIFIVLFIGYIAYFWRKPDDIHKHGEWSLGGRRFGTVVVWFLLGGDLYTAYTLIAVPGAAATPGIGGGAFAMFAITYGIMIYPIVYGTMPRLYNVSKKRGYITAADFVKDRFSSRFLAMLIALTGVLAELPYIALQITGIKYVLASLSLPISISLIIAFLLVAGFTFVSGLRGPALTAIIKDAIIWAAVLVIIVYIPLKLHGFGNIFSKAATISPNLLDISPTIDIGYVSLALGSALALFLYPHAVTGTLGSKDVKTIKRNAALLPLYNVLLMFVAIIGIMSVVYFNAYPKVSSEALPLLVLHVFPSTFTAFAFAAIVVGSIVPASIMALASANLLTRNLYLEYINPNATEKAQTNLSRVLVVVVIVAALAFSLVPAASGEIVYLQTIGGAIIMQTLPSVYLALFTRKLNKYPVGLGWLAGLATTMILLVDLHFKTSLYKGFFFMYVGIIALLINLAVVGLGMLIMAAMHRIKNEGIIEDHEFLDE